MRRLLLLPASLLMLNVSSGLAAGQSNATTTVSANPATITVGSSLGITATVQPNTAPSGGKTIPRPSGTVTFLDGATPLSAAPLVSNSYSSATFPQTFGVPDPTLTSLATITGAGEVVGDLNGDGTVDLLIYLPGTPFSIQTFTSNGKGAYTTSAVQMLSFATAAAPPSVTNYPQLIDLNGDGKLDVLCGLMVAYGNGDGTFAQAVPVSFLANGFVTSYVADLNGDGKTDIIAVPELTGEPFIDQVQFTLTVFLNQGKGSFASSGTFPVAPLSPGGSVGGLDFLPPVFVDLNGDGKLDMIVQTQTFGATQISGPQSLNVMLNQGDGTFGTYMPVTVANGQIIGPDGQFPFEMAGGDVNGDGKQDLILTVADADSNLAAIILLGKGDGTFQSDSYLILHQLENEQAIPSYLTPSVTIADLNLDGKQDLIFSDGLVALGNGDGTFVLSSPLFPPQLSSTGVFNLSLPLVQLSVPGNLVPALVYLLPAATPPVASVFTPQPSSSAVLSLTTLTAGMHSITARYSGDTNYSAETSAAFAVTVNQAASATAATSSVNPSFAGQSVTLTANVTSAGPMPTGNVTFSSGSTTLGTVALNGGSAPYTTAALTTAGAQSITVSYSGDANTQASSTTLNQVINAAFTLAPDGGSNTTLTVTAGQTVNAPINVTGAAGFSGPVALACSGLPTDASCSFSPASVNVAGTAAVPTLLTINTAASTTVGQRKLGSGAYGLALAGLILFLPRRRSGIRLLTLLLFTLGVATLGVNGCSNGSGSAPAPQVAAGTYHFMVTASSASLQTQSTYTLVVQ